MTTPRQLFKAVVQMLGIQQYDIEFEVVPLPGNSENYYGFASTLQKGWRAKVEIQEDLVGRDLLATTIHEALHVVFASQDATMHHHVLQLVPEEHRKHAESLYVDHLEECVERLAQALTTYVVRKGLFDVKELGHVQTQGGQRIVPKAKDSQVGSTGAGSLQGRNGRWVSRGRVRKSKGSSADRQSS